MYHIVKFLLESMRFSYLSSFCNENKSEKKYLNEKLLKFPGNFRKKVPAKACEYTPWLCSQYSWVGRRQREVAVLEGCF